jgi:PAS domain S-box-containing protein
MGVRAADPGGEGAARAQLAAIVASSDDAIIGKTLDGVITSWNAGAERMYGYPAQEMIGKSVAGLFPPDRVGELAPILAELRRGGRIGHFETQRVRRDGTVIDVSVSVSPILDDGGAIAGAATVARDITERNRAARAEAALTAQLAAIADSSDDAIIGLTLDGVITSWNKGAQRMFGYAPGKVIGQSMALIVPLERVAELAAMLDRLAHGERLGPVETQRVRRDGTVLDIALSAAPVRDAAGRVTGVATVGRDTTAGNRAAAARQEMEDRLRRAERMETVGQLAGGIAHDFNNLLGAIVGYAALLAEATADPAARADIGHIQAAAQRAARLTRDLLIFSRQEPVQLVPVGLNGVITGARDLLRVSVGSQVAVRFELAADLPPVLGDSGQLEQVLLNLAVNARDAMPEGGTLTIRTGAMDLAGGDLRLDAGASPGPFVELSVADTGSGMSPEVAAHVFEPFFTTKETGRGTGLGLSSVYGIVTGAGGSVGIDSVLGAGSTFRVYLPVAGPPAGAAAEPAAPAAAAVGHGELILVVDDEPSMLHVTSRILRRSGYATLEAGTSDEAVALASSHQVELLLTDSVMPGLSGVALADRIRKLNPGSPVLHMSGTGYAAQAPPQRPQVAFIQKPFTPQALLEKVSSILAAAPARPGPGTG